jgi:hypothetical protein
MHQGKATKTNKIYGRLILPLRQFPSTQQGRRPGLSLGEQFAACVCCN